MIIASIKFLFISDKIVQTDLQNKELRSEDKWLMLDI